MLHHEFLACHKCISSVVAMTDCFHCHLCHYNVHMHYHCNIITTTAALNTAWTGLQEFTWISQLLYMLSVTRSYPDAIATSENFNVDPNMMIIC